jgi:hypothetical protein
MWHGYHVRAAALGGAVSVHLHQLRTPATPFGVDPLRLHALRLTRCRLLRLCAAYLCAQLGEADPKRCGAVVRCGERAAGTSGRLEVRQVRAQPEEVGSLLVHEHYLSGRDERSVCTCVCASCETSRRQSRYRLGVV